MNLLVFLVASCAIFAGNIATPPDAKYPKCYPSSILPPEDTQANEEGTLATMSCQSKRGMPEPDLRWTRNGVEVDNQEYSVDTITQTTTNVITWELSGIDHEATITCTQTHTEADDRTCGIGPLRVRYGPDVAVEPETLTLGVGETATFNCTAKGNPAVTSIEWRFNDTTAPDLQRFVMNSDNTQLVVYNITVEDYALDIKCEAQSSRETRSKTVTLVPVNDTMLYTSDSPCNVMQGCHFIMYFIVTGICMLYAGL